MLTEQQARERVEQLGTVSGHPDWIGAPVADVVSLLLAVQKQAVESCIKACDAVADNPPDIDVSRPHWDEGHQDGAMECSAALRSLIKE